MKNSPHGLEELEQAKQAKFSLFFISDSFSPSHSVHVFHSCYASLCSEHNPPRCFLPWAMGFRLTHFLIYLEKLGGTDFMDSPENWTNWSNSVPGWVHSINGRFPIPNFRNRSLVSDSWFQNGNRFPGPCSLLVFLQSIFIVFSLWKTLSIHWLVFCRPRKSENNFLETIFLQMNIP